MSQQPFEYTINIIKQEIANHRATMASYIGESGYLEAGKRYEYQLMQEQLIKYETCLDELIKLQRLKKEMLSCKK